MSTTEDIFYLYTEAYIEGFEKSKNASYELRKDEAKKYAAEICPDGKSALVAYTNSLKNRRKPRDKYEILGHKIVIKLANLGLKDIHKKQFNEGLLKTKPIENGDNQSAVKLYRDACDKFDYIPKDIVLDHFTASSRSNWTHARRVLSEAGYVLEKENRYFYKVAHRPKPPTEDNKNGIQIDHDLISTIIAETLRKLKEGG